MRANALLQQEEAAQAAAQLAVAAAALQRSTRPDPVLGVEVPLLQAHASRALGDTAAAGQHAETGRTALATLRHPPGRLTELAKALQPAVTNAP